MMEEDEYCWVEAAMEDDAVVAEQLLRLKPPKTMEAEVVPPAVEWGVRQPRSRHVQHQLSHRSSKKEVGESTTRGSPTTPLSWSGGDSYDDSTLPPRPPPPPPPPPLPAFRSIKGAGGSDASNRKTRKKKTFAELKEEECLLLKESVYLKREVAKLQAVWEEERIQNNNLKRMKLELQRQSVNETSASDVLKETTSCDPLSHSNRDQNDTVSPSNGSECCGLDAAASCTPDLPDTSVAPIVATTWKNPEVPSVAATQKSFVVLPDLNLPLEEDYVPEDLYGTS